MKDDWKIYRLVIFILSTLILASCFDPKVMWPELYRRDLTWATPQKVEELRHQSATRRDVVDTLGRPLRYTRNDISYEYCSGIGGIIPGDHTSSDPPRKLECYELILEFDKQDRLRNFSKTPRRWDLDEHAEDMNLRELGNAGDTIAQKLWEQSRTYYNMKRDGLLEERNENEKNLYK